MALGKSKLMIFLVTMVLCDACFGGAVYKVGDSDGWTSRGHVDYNKWASRKDFYVGDTLIFVYSNQFHSVMQVTDQDFQSCNTTSPIAAYTSGSDTITLKRPGHFYFLCGTPGHCQVGQKIDVKVTLPIPNTFATPSPSSSPSSSHSEAPSLILSSASTLVLHSSKFGLAVTTFVLCLLISILEIFS